MGITVIVGVVRVQDQEDEVDFAGSVLLLDGFSCGFGGEYSIKLELFEGG
jgi:hypothetical protein